MASDNPTAGGPSSCILQRRQFKPLMRDPRRKRLDMSDLEDHSDVNPNQRGDAALLAANRESTASPREPMESARRRAPVDLLALWSTDMSAAKARLQVLRPDANSRLLIPFTTATTPADLHYVDAPSIRSYVLCPGNTCLLCELGKSQDHRELLPVYDPVIRNVVVLPISLNTRPGALLPQIRPLLMRVRGGERMIIDIRSPGRGEYTLKDFAMPESGDDGAAFIARFAEQYAAGHVDLTSVYRSLTREEMFAIPELSREAHLKGIAK
jgi:hypothetical protein